MSSAREAEEVVNLRRRLYQTGVSILDILNPAELEAHRKLWPQFTAARKDGIPAYFKRACLFIRGEEVKSD